jgi:hypothetical protein
LVKGNGGGAKLVKGNGGGAKLIKGNGGGAKLVKGNGGGANLVEGNGGGAKLVKGHAKKIFSRGHPQACGQVDQVCCEAGGLCRKIRHKQFL